MNTNGWAMAVAACVTLGMAGGIQGAVVVEPAGTIPVLHEVDVVVVGGSCGAVAAAEQAAKSGARVFLAAPRPYLGEDIAGALRLWLEDGETPQTPLAKAIFGAAAEPASGLPFTYAADRKPNGKHADPGNRLTDGKTAIASQESVQYDGDVTITIDLGAECDVRGLDLFAFRRPQEFEVGRAEVLGRTSGTNWTPLAAFADGTDADGEESVRYGADFATRIRHLQVKVARKADSPRLLLGEIVVRGPPGAAPAGDAVRPAATTKPITAKRALDRALLDAGVSFLTGSYAVDLLRDADGRPAGVVIANRSGRQAVKAKVVIDATERATVARLGGAQATTFPAGSLPFTRVVVAGEAPAGEGMTVRERPGQFLSKVSGGPVHSNMPSTVLGRTFECTLMIPMTSGSFASFAEAEQVARDRTYGPTLLDASELLFQVPPDRVAGEAAGEGAWPGAAQADLRWFRAGGVPGVWVLGGCADVSREAAAKLLRPLEFMDLGARVGAAAAAEAEKRTAPEAVTVAAAPADAVQAAQVRDVPHDGPGRTEEKPAVNAAARGLPVIGEYDVVVVGGGTGGAPAGIGAGRQKARTLVLEYQGVLGGVGTLGMIGKYYHGNICGFTSEHDAGVAAMRAAVHVVGKTEWWRKENRTAGTDMWMGVLACGAVVENGRVTGVIVATPLGRGVVKAKAVVDATGNADLAAAAGAETVFVDGAEIAVQGTGQSGRPLGSSYVNTDYGYVNESDAFDQWFFSLRARAGAAGAWDLSTLINSRERRRIVGDFTVSPLDILNGRTHPDTIVQMRSNFDSHGYTVHDVFFLADPGKQSMTAQVPYRALLPRGLDGVLVVGLGISAHRDAIPILRMQPDIQNQGYAAGVAAAMAARADTTVRKIDIKALQRHLVEKKILTPDVLTAKDSYPPSAERVAAAVATLPDDYAGLSVVLAAPEAAQPLLRAACAAATNETAKLTYAQVLGMMGDAAGVPALVAAVAAAPKWDAGWQFKGMGQFGRSVSDLDGTIIALGRTRDPRALEPILRLTAQLEAKDAVSHYRAVARALEAFKDPAAARVLADVLKKPGVRGHALKSKFDLQPLKGNADALGNEERGRCLKEISLARALFRCGDHEGLGADILFKYANDPRGVYALHAVLVLAGR